MSESLKIAVAGLGTVGSGTLQLIQAHNDLIAARCGRPIMVSAVSARDRRKNRALDLSAVRWFEDPVAMAADPEIDVVLELIGGSDGVARQVIERAIEARHHVITANKALLAHHGTALARAAEAAGVTLGYEAAVAGGIPVIKGLREGLAANSITRVYGILNGTCNFILSTMRETGREFGEVLLEAQKLGYAEADPGFDVDGVDAAHKLAILTALAFGCEVNLPGVYIEGIREVSALDIAYAGELGYRIKLLGIASRRDGGVEQRVYPCMVGQGTPIANVEGVFNAVVADGDFVGTILAEGRGAGAGPTASAVVADLIDIARGTSLPTFAVPARDLIAMPSLPIERHVGSHYIRLMVVDRPGVIADVAAALRDEHISVEAMLQRGRAPGEAVPVVITTHETRESAMANALARIAELDTVLEPPRRIRIETL
ncbi:MAG: homoserine dehydrogenase [Kiloniellaceae bacterium]